MSLHDKLKEIAELRDGITNKLNELTFDNESTTAFEMRNMREGYSVALTKIAEGIREERDRITNLTAHRVGDLTGKQFFSQNDAYNQGRSDGILEAVKGIPYAAQLDELTKEPDGRPSKQD